LKLPRSPGLKRWASPSLPHPWFVRLAWAIHRAAYRITGGRRGLWKPKPGNWGTIRLTTIGRKTTRKVRGRAAVGEEHDRLWAKWAEINDKLDGYASRRPGGTAVVILEPVAE
jgi:hypothetical protein